MGHDLYAAVVTSVPFLLLALVATDLPVFGPAKGGSRRSRRWDAITDGFALSSLALAFGLSLIGLSMEDPPDFRSIAAGGLALGAAGVFLQALVRVILLYRAAAEPTTAAEVDADLDLDLAAPEAYPPSVLSMSAMEGVCSDTRNGWLWYCDEHDTHGNADEEDEAQDMAQAHVEYFLEQDDDEPCRVIVWQRTDHERARRLAHPL